MSIYVPSGYSSSHVNGGDGLRRLRCDACDAPTVRRCDARRRWPFMRSASRRCGHAVSHAAHQLGQLRHIDLLALAIEAGAAPTDEDAFKLSELSRDDLIDVLTQSEMLPRIEVLLERRPAP